MYLCSTRICLDLVQTNEEKEKKKAEEKKNAENGFFRSISFSSDFWESERDD